MGVDKADVDAVKEFARLTGDIFSISDVDTKVIALGYKLARENGVLDKIRKEP